METPIVLRAEPVPLADEEALDCELPWEHAASAAITTTVEAMRASALFKQFSFVMCDVSPLSTSCDVSLVQSVEKPSAPSGGTAFYGPRPASDRPTAGARRRAGTCPGGFSPAMPLRARLSIRNRDTALDRAYAA